jgi:hypothetical protein
MSRNAANQVCVPAPATPRLAAASCRRLSAVQSVARLRAARQRKSAEPHLGIASVGRANGRDDADGSKD